MPYRDISSLDRFINLRGPTLADPPSKKRGPLGWLLSIVETSIVGFVALLVLATLTLSALVLAACLVAALVETAGAGQLIGSLLALGTLVFACSTMGSYVLDEWPLARLRRADLRLTREARALLHGLVTHVEGWPPPRDQHRRRFRDVSTRGLFRSRHDRRCEDLLDSEAFRILNAAAREYNRIAGALAPNHTPGARASEIRAAIDEAMAEVLHATAHLNRLPERDAPWRARAEERVRELTELADQLQRLQAIQEPRIPAPDGPSRIERLLEALRADELARAELEGDAPG